MRRALLGLLLAGCIPATQGKHVGFHAEAVGDASARTFTTSRGYDVTLTRARLRIGALYLNQSNPAGWSQDPACVLPGIYTGEVRGGVDVDALSDSPQPFAVDGNGTDFPTRAAELWLTSGDVDAEDDRTPVLEAAGIARRGTEGVPFDVAVTIGRERAVPPRNPALPGASPICKQRIVSPIPAELTLAEGSTVRVTLDPRRWFDGVEFADSAQADAALFNALRAASVETYRITLSQ